MDYVKTLKDIAIELVEDKEHLEVRQMPSLDENVVVLQPGGDHSAMVFSLAATASRIILTQVSRPRAALMARS